VRSIAATYKKYPHCKDILPAMGYGKPQMRDLKETVARIPADLIVVGTPIDLRRVIDFNKKAVRVRYELAEVVPGKLKQIIKKIVK
jgi:predicted GTPase